MKLQSIIEATKLKEGEERSEIKDLMIPHIKEYLERKGPGSFISMEDLESDLYDFARRITHDDLNSPQYLRDFMSNPGDEASSAVGELISGMYQAEFDDYITTEGRIEDTFGTKTIDKHDRPEKKKPKKEDIELNDNMIGEPDDFYGAEERQEAHKDLQDALQGNYMDDYIIDGSCPACGGSGYMDGEETFTNDDGEEEESSECDGFGNYGCDEGEMTYGSDGPSWVEIIKHDKRQADRKDAIANYPGDETVIKQIANMVRGMEDPRNAMQQMAIDYPQMGRRQRAELVSRGMKAAGLTKEGIFTKHSNDPVAPGGQSSKRKNLHATGDRVSLDGKEYVVTKVDLNKGTVDVVDRDGNRSPDVKAGVFSPGIKFGDRKSSTIGNFPSDNRDPRLFDGKSPHKKGTKKYKKHMAAMHAGMGEGMNEMKTVKTAVGMFPTNDQGGPLSGEEYHVWTMQNEKNPPKERIISQRYQLYLQDFKQYVRTESIQAGDELMIETGMGEGVIAPVIHVVGENVLISWDATADSLFEETEEIDEGEKHGNSKIYNKCWKGYSKVPGKKAGEKGSCKKNEDVDLERMKHLAGIEEAVVQAVTKEEVDNAMKDIKRNGLPVSGKFVNWCKENNCAFNPRVLDKDANELKKAAIAKVQFNKDTGYETNGELIRQSSDKPPKQGELPFTPKDPEQTEFKFEDSDLDEAEYQGRKVKLGKPTRGDVKKFKVYVKDPKTGNVKKLNFGHGGSSAKKAGQKTMKIKKSNPARRKSFRARHNCDNPGPRTKARYWSCRAW